MARVRSLERLAALSAVVGALLPVAIPASADAGSLAGARAASAVPAKPAIPPREKEIAMALSAAPEYLRPGAAVYVLAPHGFVKVRATTNGFTCIVNRDHPLNLKPVCYDAEGTRTILPVVLRFGELLMQSVPLDRIRAQIRAGFTSGRFRSPRRAGVAYMLSGEIRNYDPSTGQVGSFPPHVMFYAPNLTNRDIGSRGDFAYGLPSIGYRGPQGFMIVVCGNYCGAAAVPMKR